MLKPITIGFHDVVDEILSARPAAAGHTTVYSIDRRTFRAHLEAIRMSAGAAVVQRVRQDHISSYDPPDSSVLLTFDDGTIGCLTCAAPELESLGWRGHFFIATSWIGKPGFMDYKDIADLHLRGHVIGSHSVSHPERMSHLSASRLIGEWSESCKTLAAITGSAVTVASVPGGYCSRMVCRTAAACGIRVLFTSEPTTRVRVVDGCTVLGRYAVRRSTPPGVCGAIAGGARGPRYAEAALWSLKEAAKRIGGESYLHLRRMLLAGQGGKAVGTAAGGEQ